jgi:hypothetical protein
VFCWAKASLLIIWWVEDAFSDKDIEEISTRAIITSLSLVL